jgi:DNA transformation protein
MAVSKTFAEFLRDQLGGLGEVSVRRMFGGAGVYCDGLMFGLVADETLYFRVDDGNQPAFRAEGLEPFSYDGKGRTILLPYWRVPERLFDEPDEMLAWARAALAAARRVAAKKRSKPLRPARPVHASRAAPADAPNAPASRKAGRHGGRT